MDIEILHHLSSQHKKNRKTAVQFCGKMYLLSISQSIIRREKAPLRSKREQFKLNVQSRRSTLNTSILPNQRISEYATKATSSPRIAKWSTDALWNGETCFGVNREYGHFNSFHSLSEHSHIKNRTKPIIFLVGTGIRLSLFPHPPKSLDATSFSIQPFSVGGLLRALKG